MTAIAISWADLARLKKAAKASSTLYPHLSHAQRLDALAASEFGVRHFHELKQRYEAGVAACIDRRGPTHRCRFCGLEFDGEAPEDRKLHKEQHQRYEEANMVRNYLPAQYAERERIKRQGYEWMRSPNAAQQREGALAILLSHFDRSLDAAILDNRWPSHPYFEEYVQAALAGAGFIPSSIRERLVQEFGVRGGLIASGSSYWPAHATPRMSVGSQVGVPLERWLRQRIMSVAPPVQDNAG